MKTNIHKGSCAQKKKGANVKKKKINNEDERPEEEEISKNFAIKRIGREK